MQLVDHLRGSLSVLSADMKKKQKGKKKKKQEEEERTAEEEEELEKQKVRAACGFINSEL